MNTRSCPSDMPFWARHITLIRVEGNLVTFAQNKGEKTEMLTGAIDAMKLDSVFFLVAWAGEWTTDVFHVTVDNITKWVTP